jgi:internalin A
MESPLLLNLIAQADKEKWKELDLSGIKLSELPQKIGKLTSLTSLQLGNNELNALPKSIEKLINLTSLNLCNNKLNALPESIIQLKNLTSLNLSSNNFNDFPEFIGKLTSLTSLQFDNNELNALPKSIEKLISLTSLNLCNNKLNALPESIIQLKNLTSLNLRSNNFNGFPEFIGQLTSLTSLDLWNNQLNTFPECISQLTNLISLNLCNNELNALPESIIQLKNLISLNLSSNNFNDFPEFIGQLTSLTSLDLWNNQLNTFPECISQLTNLTSLNLCNNELNALPESIIQLKNLISLNLSSNNFNDFPEFIGQLTSLTSLDFDCNGLNILPESIGQLTNLTSLYLWNNQLNILPESIIQLANLTFLDICNNQLDALPESIGKLANLTFLNICSNQLDALPESIGKLANLKKLIIDGNPLIKIPPEIVEKGGLAVRDYYRQRLEENTDYIYEAKLLIIGEGGAGKTSLANKLIDSTYKLKLEGCNNPEKSTEGIDVLRFDFPHSSGNDFRINIWDFGGQEIYHATHQFFLTKRSLYLLVADTRQDNTDFNYWLEVVELLSQASPALIVKNEKQDRPCQVNENQLRGRFPNLEKVLPTNLSDNRGLPDIIAAIQHHISQLPHIGQPLPKTWVRVRAALEADTRNYITQLEFLDLCNTHGFKRNEDALQLSGYLHDLGVCLHFQDDPILKNIVILKPEWGTAAVYKVLDTKQVNQNFGCFTQADLTEIWLEEQYTQMRDELLQLMKNFKLCYEIPNRPKNYIAPQLLSSNQPEYNWDDTENLILRYHYEFMPKGMLTRFSVEMHRLIDSDLIWKDGVILANNNARAEVIEAYYKKEIRIRISGKFKKSLLEKIRHEFDNIHASYNKPEESPENHRLRYQEFIPCNCLKCYGSQSPHSYALKNLEERIKNDRREIECDISYKMVNVRDLIDDAIGPSQFDRSTRLNSSTEKESSDKTIGTSSGISLQIVNQYEVNPVTDQSKKIQNFNAPMSGVIASDNALVIDNTFTQTNNANTAEILNLIATLRATTAQFPTEIQESAIIDIEDIEIEIQKPADQRSITRLKRSLIALFGIASLIATPIAGMTDFTNNVLEISNKLHIELPQLP